MGRYADLIASGRMVLTDAATGTRVRLETRTPLHPILDLASLPGTAHARALEAVAGEYVAIAGATGLPIQLDTMSYWASPDHLAAANIDDQLERVNRACVEVLAPVRTRAETYVAGVIGPRADGYRGSGSMDPGSASRYHQRQADALAGAGVDLLFASTMSSADEAEGLAAALAATGLDYIVGFVIDAAGDLPDGTSLARAIDRVDRCAPVPPVHHLISCTHPDTARRALDRLAAAGHDLSRVLGIKGNGSDASPDQLESSADVLSDPPTSWTDSVLGLRSAHGLRMLGGCCGTDGRHLLDLALRLADG